MSITKHDSVAAVITPISSLIDAGLLANESAARATFNDHRQRKSENTLSAHRSDLTTFNHYLCAAGVDCLTVGQMETEPKAWRGVTWGIVAGFVQWMLREGLTLSSINRKLSTVKAYAALAAQANMIDGAELALIKAVKGFAAKEAKRVNEKRAANGVATRKGSKKATSTSLTAAQVKALKMQPDTPQGRRDAVIMALLLDHGLRVGELADLDVDAVDLAAGELRFYRPKVSKLQTHRLAKDALAALRAYKPDAPTAGSLLRGSLKSGELSGPGMSRQTITERVGELGQRIGVDGLSAHDLRHSWATRAIRNKSDPFAVLQAGGWTSMQTVQRYVDESAIANAGILEE